MRCGGGIVTDAGRLSCQSSYSICKFRMGVIADSFSGLMLIQFRGLCTVCLSQMFEPQHCQDLHQSIGHLAHIVVSRSCKCACCCEAEMHCGWGALACAKCMGWHGMQATAEIPIPDQHFIP